VTRAEHEKSKAMEAKATPGPWLADRGEGTGRESRVMVKIADLGPDPEERLFSMFQVASCPRDVHIHIDRETGSLFAHLAIDQYVQFPDEAWRAHVSGNLEFIPHARNVLPKYQDMLERAMDVIGSAGTIPGCSCKRCELVREWEGKA